MYIVYCHTNKINGKRYVGITKQKPDRRWSNGHGYINNDHFYNSIKKYGWEEFYHEILFTGLSKEEAQNKEIELIAKWDLTNNEKGYNKAPGGNLLPELSDESKLKISNTLKETYKKSQHPCFGRPMSARCKEIMKNANDRRKKPVLQYSLSGDFIKEYSSLRELERETGFHRAAIKDNIVGKSSQSYGFIWKFKEDKN